MNITPKKYQKFLKKRFYDWCIRAGNWHAKQKISRESSNEPLAFMGGFVIGILFALVLFIYARNP